MYLYQSPTYLTLSCKNLYLHKLSYFANNYNTLIKKFPEFIQKIQNTSFIHQKWYCPLQSTSHRLQRTYASAW